MWLTGNMIVDTLAKIRQYGLEYTFRRFYSKYKGTVEINADPQQQGRVKVSCADTGKLTVDETGTVATPEMLELYAYPSSPFAGNNYGFYFPPEVGDQVWVWFDYGDPTQPNLSGGWWRNPGTQANSAAKTAATTEIPAEFVSASTIPTTRGIKTKRGHGISFEDDTVTKNTGIRIWTGEPATPLTVGGPALPAIVHHELQFSDRDKYVRLETTGPSVAAPLGHITIWDDRPAFSGIKSFSVYGHEIVMDDVTKTISLTTALGHTIVIDDFLNQIMAKTVLGNTIVMSDPSQTISVTTPLKQSVVMNDSSLTMNVTTPGTINATAAVAANVTTAGNAAVTSGAATTVTAGGLLSLIANGINITSTGVAPCVTVGGGTYAGTFTGLVSNTFNGGISQVVNGSYSDTISGPWTIVTSAGTIGKATSPKFYLVTEAFFTIFNTHTHPSVGAPPLQQIVPPTSPTQPIPDPLISAPQFDKRVFLTADLQAS